MVVEYIEVGTALSITTPGKLLRVAMYLGMVKINKLTLSACVLH